MNDMAQPPTPPKQRKDYDLTSKKNGKGGAVNAPPMLHKKADNRDPGAMMRAMGFEPGDNMTPLQFLVAVMNDKVDMIYKTGEKAKKTIAAGGISMSYRIECAKTAAKFLHMEMPKVAIQEETQKGFGSQLEQAVNSGNERIRKKTLIIEEVERLSPDMPLPDASYPPAFDNAPERNVYVDDADVVSSGSIMDEYELNPEGDTEYNPDADD